MMEHPEAACGHLPLEGAPLAARQSRFRGGRAKAADRTSHGS